MHKRETTRHELYFFFFKSMAALPSAAAVALVTLLGFFSVCLYPVTASSNSNVMDLCASSPHASFCRDTLLNLADANLQYYGRYLLRKSLSGAREFLVSVDGEIEIARRDSRIPTASFRALEDCRHLASLSVKLLMTVHDYVRHNESTIDDERVSKAHTMLSAVLTNQHTCIDTLASSKTWISERAVEDTKMYGVALSFFTKAWVRGTDSKDQAPLMSLPKWKQLGLFQEDKMATFAAYKSVTGRRNIDLDDGDNSHQRVTVGEVVVVSKDRTGNFTSIKQAIAAAPENRRQRDGYYMIYVKAGVYHEYLDINPRKSYIMIVGDGINKTVITGNRSAPDGWGTFSSATFSKFSVILRLYGQNFKTNYIFCFFFPVLYGPYFVGMDFSVQNTAGPSKGQAVALTSAADQSTFYHCSFEGYQDTLFTHSNTQVFRECDIYGTVDFIFGNAGVLLDRCNIYPRLPIRGQHNEITAQGRSHPDQNTGTFLHNCTVMASTELSLSKYPVTTQLGRPWKEYSRTVVMHTFLDTLVHPSGWDAWQGDFALSTLYYAEYRNRGPRSDTSNRVKWPGIHIWNRSDAQTFLASTFPMYLDEL